MPIDLTNTYDAQRLTTLTSSYAVNPFPTAHRINGQHRFIPPQAPIPLRSLRSLPPHCKPSLTPSSSTQSTASPKHEYPPSPYITPKPSISSIIDRGYGQGSSQRLF